MDFIPETKFTQRDIPFFEDAGAKASLAGADLRKPVTHYQNLVSTALNEVGGLVTSIVPGTYPGAKPRYGYRINFVVNGIPGRMDIAALPIRAETAVKKEKALKQALYLLWKELDAANDGWAYRPNYMPLIPFLIGSNGKTATEELIGRGILPDVKPALYLPAPSGR